MRIIPSINIIDSKCAGSCGRDLSTDNLFSNDPIDMAKIFEDMGMQYLHLVDLNGISTGEIVIHSIIEKIASKTNLFIDFRGGIRSEADIELIFNCGVKQIVIGSIAAEDPFVMLKWLKKYGEDRIVLETHCKNQKITANGWLENSEQDIVPFIRGYEKIGAKFIILSDENNDEPALKPAFELYAAVLSETHQVNLIASGGISSKDDIIKLKNLGCEGAILDEAIYNKKISLRELSGLDFFIILSR